MSYSKALVRLTLFPEIFRLKLFSRVIEDLTNALFSTDDRIHQRGIHVCVQATRTGCEDQVPDGPASGFRTSATHSSKSLVGTHIAENSPPKSWTGVTPTTSGVPRS